MLRRISARRPSHGTIVAYLALFVALSGSAYAAATIGSGQIKNNAILSKHIKPGEVKGTDIAADSMSSAKVAGNSLTGADINESSLGQVPLAGLAALATEANHSSKADQATNAGHANSADQATDAGHATNSDQLGGLAPSSFLSAGNVRKVDFARTPCHAGCLETPLDLGSFKIQTACLTTGMTENGARIDVSATASGPNARVDWLNVAGGVASNGQASGGALFSVPATTGASVKFSGAIVYRDDTTVVSVPFGGSVSHSGTSAACQFAGTATKSP
jgi:hypothetical protein